MTANEMVKDYASMTDEQLNREVAERRGYTVVHVDEAAGEYPCFSNHRGWLYDYIALPDGECREIENVANDNNAAAALDFGEHAVVIIERRRGYNWVEVQGMEIGAFHDNLARAITVCWLMYKDAQS